MIPAVIYVILLAIPVVFYSLFPYKVKPSVHHIRRNELQIAGSIQPVLDGKIRKEITVAIKPDDFSCSLGCGSFGDLQELGESIGFDNKIFIKSTSERKNYGVESSVVKNDTFGTMSHRPIFTPFSVGMSKTSEFQKEVTVRKKSLETFFNQQLPYFDNECFGVYGRATFSNITILAIKKSPMEGKSLMVQKNRPHYFHKKVEKSNIEAIFVGVVARTSNEFFQNNQPVSNKLFHSVYVKEGIDDRLFSHTHVAIVEKKGESDDYFNTELLEVVDVQHLFVESVIDFGKIRVFDIHGYRSIG